MIDYEAVINRMRVVTDLPYERQMDEGPALAADYSQACIEANQRLHRCADYLRRGLVGEALQLAEATPDLLNMVSMLDLPQTEAWRTLCMQNDWPIAPALDMEAASLINDAYNQRAGIDPLLGQHRLLALGRAALTHRIAVARELAYQDVRATFWKQDVQALEAARIDEMRRQAQQAVRENNLPVLEQLASELDAAKWTCDVPAELRGMVQNHRRSLAQQEALAGARDLLRQLQEAYEAVCLPDCQSLLSQWRALVAAEHLEIPPEMQSQLEPIAQWVDAEEAASRARAAFEQDCAALGQALESHAPAEKLQALFQQAESHGVPLPDRLLLDYHAALARHAAARRRRRRAFMATGAVGACVALAAGGWAVHTLMVRKTVSRWKHALHQADQQVRVAGNQQKASAVLAAFAARHPALSHTAAFAPLVKKLRTDMRRETRRRIQFAALLARLRKAGVAHATTGLLSAAGALALLPEEKASVLAWRQRVAAYQAHMQQRDALAALHRATALDATIHTTLTRARLAKSPAAFYASCQALRHELVRAQAAANGPHTAALLQAAARALRRRVNWYSQLTQRRRALAALEQGVSSVGAYVAAARQYIATAPDSPLAADLKTNLRSVAAQRAVAAWGRLAANWGGHMQPSSTADARQRRKEAAAYQNRYPGSPLSTRVARYGQYLKQCVVASSSRGPLLRGLNSLVHNPLLRRLKVVRDSQGTRYYVRGSLSIRRDSIGESFLAVTKPGRKSRQRVHLPLGVTLRNRKPRSSGQRRFALEALGRLRLLGPDDWKTIGLSLASLARRQKMNRLLQGVLVERLLRLTHEGLGPLLPYQHLASTVTQLREQKIEALNWLSPRHRYLARKRRVAHILAAMPPLRPLEKRVERRIKAICQGAAFIPFGEGIALRRGGVWSVDMGAKAQSGDTAWALTSPNQALRKLANYSDQHWHMRSGVISGIANGALVFVVRPAARH